VLVIPPPPASPRKKEAESTNGAQVDPLEIPWKKIPILAFSLALCLSLRGTFVRAEPLAVNPSSFGPSSVLGSREYQSEMDISVSITFHIRQRARGARRNRAVTSIASARLSRGNMTSLAASCVDVGLHRSFNHITRLRRASVSPSFCLDLIE